MVCFPVIYRSKNYAAGVTWRKRFHAKAQRQENKAQSCLIPLHLCVKIKYSQPALLFTIPLFKVLVVEFFT